MRKKPNQAKAKKTARAKTGYEGVPDQQLQFLVSQTKGTYQEAEQVLMRAGSTLGTLMEEVKRRKKNAKSNKDSGGAPTGSG